jgi:hypothetical protein
MGNIVFRCPHTGMHVQHWMAEEVTGETPRGIYDTVVCNACARIHFINRRTGKLLGDSVDSRTARTERGVSRTAG